ncbi:hypothetical protein B0H17DRAFT_1140147 [Mycena rosella]|uniref:Uncharacterized protein n=1 Tax=Mycena rosella TaxID=1033263 RepID=A0AAD7D349_MYCRO|nr:hypothetical protein B0H17DRAFT_1140147 [Mycena rosella]
MLFILASPWSYYAQVRAYLGRQRPDRLDQPLSNLGVKAAARPGKLALIRGPRAQRGVDERAQCACGRKGIGKDREEEVKEEKRKDKGKKANPPNPAPEPAPRAIPAAHTRGTGPRGCLCPARTVKDRGAAQVQAVHGDELGYERGWGGRELEGEGREAGGGERGGQVGEP